jgi:hypothetical protein
MTTILSSSGSCNKKETGDQCEANPIVQRQETLSAFAERREPISSPITLLRAGAWLICPDATMLFDLESTAPSSCCRRYKLVVLTVRLLECMT